MTHTVNKQRVFLMLSGGVDSAVAGILLKRQGFDVHGVFIRTWATDDPRYPCVTKEDFESAQRTAEQLDISLELWDFTKAYWDRIVTRMIREYEEGQTPNPDVWCNNEIKFGLFLDRARAQGASQVATGHHARIQKRSANGKTQYALCAGKDAEKDQSYFLWRLTQEQLSYSLFPIGEFTKQQVREIARQEGFENWNRRSSRGLCFVGPINFREFLQDHIQEKKGEVVMSDGTVVGTHRGLAYYTIGQREGLGIPLQERCYVARKDTRSNRIILAKEKESVLWSREIEARDVHWVSNTAPTFPYTCNARIRYRQPLQPCIIEPGMKSGQVRVLFHTDQKAVASGQSIVFYHEDELIGGAVIR